MNRIHITKGNPPLQPDHDGLIGGLKSGCPDANCQTLTQGLQGAFDMSDVAAVVQAQQAPMDVLGKYSLT